jgi:FAD:protein FMN transferase
LEASGTTAARALALLAALAPAAAAAPPATAAPAAVVFSGPAMGSRYSVRVVMAGGDEAANEQVRGAIDRELRLVDQQLSGWNPASEISRLSAHASTAPFSVSAPTLEALRLCRRASELSGGAFDVTVEPLVAAWGFGPAGGTHRVPGDDELAALRARVDYRLLSVDVERGEVRKARADLACDLSSIGDGWASDRIARAIVALGHPDVLVDVAGEVAARGRRPDGGRWKVAVEWPDGAPEHTLLLELADEGVSTSGDYRKSWSDAQGRSFSHIIDPRSGRPIDHALASVSVVDRDLAWADVLSTALMVMGPEAGRALAARERLAARFVKRLPDGSFAEWSTPEFERSVVVPQQGAGAPRKP